MIQSLTVIAAGSRVESSEQRQSTITRSSCFYTLCPYTNFSQDGFTCQAQISIVCICLLRPLGTSHWPLTRPHRNLTNLQSQLQFTPPHPPPNRNLVFFDWFHSPHKLYHDTISHNGFLHESGSKSINSYNQNSQCPPCTPNPDLLHHLTLYAF